MTTIRYRRAESAKSRFFGQLLVDFLAALAGGWMFMIAVGIVHHEWIRACPTIGFGWAVLIGALFRGAFFLNGQTKRGDR